MSSFHAEDERRIRGDSTWSWHLASNTFDASPGYRMLLGIEHQHALRPFHIVPLLAEPDREGVLDALFRTIAGEEQSAVTFRLALPDGRTPLVTGTAHVLRDEAGAAAVLRGRLYEVTEPGGRSGQDQPAASDDAISVAVIGSDRLARLGVRSLLSGFAGVRVDADVSPSEEAIAALRADPIAWRRFDAVIVDVGASKALLLDFLETLRTAHPAVRIIARVQPEAFQSVARLARAGVDRLVTSEVSDNALARIVMDSNGVAHPAPPPDERHLLAGESYALEVASRLTESETKVLRMLARGYRNREIAGTLFVSEPTVKRYTQQIYRKLGARDRAHAAALANRLRLD
jgi:DNA-binding NarL/FixJ family response regulator